MVSPYNISQMQNRFWWRSVRRRRPGGGENHEISRFSPFYLTDSTLKTLFMIEKYNNIKYKSVVYQKPPLHRPRGGLRRGGFYICNHIISLILFKIDMVSPYNKSQMQNRFWRRSVRRRRPGGGENQKISNINPFHLTDSTLKTLFMIKKYNNIKYESVVQQRSPLHRPRGGLRRKMADFIIVIISLV